MSRPTVWTTEHVVRNPDHVITLDTAGIAQELGACVVPGQRLRITVELLPPGLSADPDAPRYCPRDGSRLKPDVDEEGEDLGPVCARCGWIPEDDGDVCGAESAMGVGRCVLPPGHHGGHERRAWTWGGDDYRAESIDVSSTLWNPALGDVLAASLTR